MTKAPCALGAVAGFSREPLESLRLHPSLIPVRFGEKPLQLVGTRQVRSHQGFCVDQASERFIAFTGA